MRALCILLAATARAKRYELNLELRRALARRRHALGQRLGADALWSPAAAPRAEALAAAARFCFQRRVRAVMVRWRSMAVRRFSSSRVRSMV